MRVFVLAMALVLVCADASSQQRFLNLDFAQESYLKGLNTEAGDRFGGAVAVDGEWLAVGASYEGGDFNALGLSGAVYVFRMTKSGWQQDAYLQAAAPDIGDSFGAAVAVRGNTIVVGAPGESSGVPGNPNDNSSEQAGAVYVFIHDGTEWLEQGYLKASNIGSFDYFGAAVAVDGDVIVVGTQWEDSAASGVNGDQGSDAAMDAGAAYVFRRSGQAWTQEAYLKASNPGAGDEFGDSVAISGDTIVVGARDEDSGRGGVGDAENAGAAYVFQREAGLWEPAGFLKSSNADAGDRFGEDVAIDGSTIVVGAPFEASASVDDPEDDSLEIAGAVYVFEPSIEGWIQTDYLKAPNPGSGDWFSSVAIDGELLLVGAFGEDGSSRVVNGAHDDNRELSGAAYTFTRRSLGWRHHAYLKAENADSGDYLGWSVALSGETAVAGALFESSAAQTVDGDGSDNSAMFAGAAYTFLGIPDPDLIFRDSLED